MCQAVEYDVIKVNVHPKGEEFKNIPVTPAIYTDIKEDKTLNNKLINNE